MTRKKVEEVWARGARKRKGVSSDYRETRRRGFDALGRAFGNDEEEDD